MKFYMGQFPHAFEKDNSRYSYREEDGSVVRYMAGHDDVTEEWIAFLKKEHRAEILSDKRQRRNRFNGEGYSDMVISIDTYGIDNFERYFGIQDASPYGEATLIEAEERADLHEKFLRFWRSLTLQQQHLLLDVAITGIPQKEIAGREGVSAVAICNRLKKIRKKAKKFLLTWVNQS